MTISGERTEQLDIFYRVTGFTSDFLGFIDVELILFFHGALQLCVAGAGSPGLRLNEFVCFKPVGALELLNFST